jgi:hypothetical protein
MSQAIRITTDSEFYQEHTESVELWSPGCPVFPRPQNAAGLDELRIHSGINWLLDSNGRLRAASFTPVAIKTSGGAGFETLSKRASAYLQQHLGEDHKWTIINRAIWASMSANPDNVLLLSDIDSILEPGSSDPHDVLAVIALLSEPSCGLLKMNYRSGSQAGEVSNIEVMKRLRAWWREESITNDEWKAWAGGIVVAWTPVDSKARLQ